MVTTTFAYSGIDFGAGDKAASFQGPKGLTGKLREVILPNVTEVFNSVTTEAQITIGTATDADAYALVNLGDLAATDTFVTSQDDTDGIIVDAIPADTQVEVAFIAPTGGTPTGIADVQIVVDWY
jgi:hypothetical protein